MNITLLTYLEHEGDKKYDNMLVGVWKDSLIARLGPDDGDLALLEPHVKEFDITGRRKVSRATSSWASGSSGRRSS